MKFSKYRDVSQKRWCVLTGKRAYFFESFWASKYSAPTEVIPWSRVLYARYACCGPKTRTLTICCNSRLLGIRSVHVDLFWEGADMDSTWCECFAKLQGATRFVADLAEASGAYVEEPAQEPRPAGTGGRLPADAVDVCSGTLRINTGGSGLRRIPKMSRIASVRGEQLASSGGSSPVTTVQDHAESISSGSIASDAFIEDPDRSGLSFSFRYGKETSSADLCANYQLTKASSSISTMGSDPDLDEECDASSIVASEIGDTLSDMLSPFSLTHVRETCEGN
jgi:hypothetical protein